MLIYTCPKCGRDLQAVVYTTMPPINGYICFNCGWKHEEDPKDIINRVPFPVSKEESNLCSL